MKGLISKNLWKSVLMLMFFPLMMLTSCKPTIPSEYIQPDEMEDILYDYHIATSISQVKNYTPVTQEVLEESVLKKYGVTQKQFDASLAYYVRHTEHLKKIYEGLSERYETEARAQGALVSDFNQYGGAVQKGDTADVWNKAKSLLLSPYPPRNYETFAIKADTSYHKGDRITLEFDPQFIIQDGAREAVAVLAVTFSNDSVASQSLNILSDSHQILAVDNPDSLGIKDIRGMFIMMQPQMPTNTFRLLLINNIRLIKMHARKQNNEQLSSDTLNNTGPLRTVGGEPVQRPTDNTPPPTPPTCPQSSQGMQLQKTNKPILQKANNGGGAKLERQRTPQQAMEERNIHPPKF